MFVLATDLNYIKNIVIVSLELLCSLSRCVFRMLRANTLPLR